MDRYRAQGGDQAAQERLDQLAKERRGPSPAMTKRPVRRCRHESQRSRTNNYRDLIKAPGTFHDAFSADGPWYAAYRLGDAASVYVHALDDW